MNKLAQYEGINWIGWYLKTPVNICQQWNKSRSRQVPDDVIIAMNQSLRQFPLSD